MAEVPRFADPGGRLYGAFGLGRGSALQLFSSGVLSRGLPALLRHGVGRPQGDPLRMPGAFLLENGRIVGAHRHREISERPDYLSL